VVRYYPAPDGGPSWAVEEEACNAGNFAGALNDKAQIVLDYRRKSHNVSPRRFRGIHSSATHACISRCTTVEIVLHFSHRFRRSNLDYDFDDLRPVTAKMSASAAIFSPRFLTGPPAHGTEEYSRLDCDE